MTTGYRAFHRGLLTGLLGLAGSIATTVLVVSYADDVITLVLPWLKTDQAFSTFVIFWCLFLIGLLTMYQVMKVISRLFTWEKLNIVTQILAAVAGLVRGAWWAGFLLLALTSSGVPYLQKSVVERSALESYVLPPVKNAVEQFSDIVQGGRANAGPLIPPLVAGASP
ncbi:MAG: CvpA family protein [Candidatus Omnitrophica bacterium]|nr:CvpA family protein [Candidatus Omnitrophota bacterium]